MNRIERAKERDEHRKYSDKHTLLRYQMNSVSQCVQLEASSSRTHTGASSRVDILFAEDRICHSNNTSI